MVDEVNENILGGLGSCKFLESVKQTRLSVKVDQLLTKQGRRSQAK